MSTYWDMDGYNDNVSTVCLIKDTTWKIRDLNFCLWILHNNISHIRQHDWVIKITESCTGLNRAFISVGVSPLQMDAPSCDIYRLCSLLPRLGEPSPRTVIFMIVLRWGEVSPSYRLYMYYFPSIYFLSLISESCYHLNLPLTIKISLCCVDYIVFQGGVCISSINPTNKTNPFCIINADKVQQDCITGERIHFPLNTDKVWFGLLGFMAYQPL